MRFFKVAVTIGQYCQGGVCAAEEPALLDLDATDLPEEASLMQRRVLGEARVGPGNAAQTEAPSWGACKKPCDYCSQLCGSSLGYEGIAFLGCKGRCEGRFALVTSGFDLYCGHGVCGPRFKRVSLEDDEYDEDDDGIEQASLLQQGVHERPRGEATAGMDAAVRKEL